MTTPTSAHFDITVATTPDATVSVQSEIRLLKAALLYGDTVTLCSGTVSYYLSLLDRAGVTNTAQRFKYLLGPLAFDLTADERQHLANLWQEYSALATKGDRSPVESAHIEALQQAVNQVWRLMAEDTAQMVRSAGLDELTPALQSGLVRVYPFEVDPSGEFMNEYLRVLIGSVTSGTTYPLLDAGASLGIQAAIHDGLIAPSSVEIQHSRSSMLPADIVQRLPHFEVATFDDIIRIRHELERPLAQFRSAVLRWSSDMRSVPWDKDFEIEAQDVYIQHVVPAVQELEQAVEDNKFTRTLQHKVMTDNGLLKPAALGIAVSLLSAVTHIMQATVIAGAWGIAEVREGLRIWAEAKQEHDAVRQSIEQNQLYFVYQAGQSLKRSRETR